MPFNLNDFRAHINSKGGPSKPSLFEVVIPLINAGTSKDLTLQCESAELTGKALQTAEEKIYGPVTKIPYQTSFQDISLTFICTNNFYERQLFENWIQSIMPLTTNNLRFPKDPQGGYLTDISIKQFNEVGSVIMTMKLIEAFPIAIGSQSLSWADDGIHRLVVQFAFKKYETSRGRDTEVF